MKGKGLLFFVALTIPLMLALTVWQSTRYGNIEREIAALEKSQLEWIESNKRLIAGIAVLSSAERIDAIASKTLGLEKKAPEEIMVINFTGGENR